MSTRDRISDLEKRRAANRAMGGEERLARQRAKGKLDARSRLDLLFDPGTFQEYGLLAGQNGALPGEESAPSPADAVITGVGEVDGRMVCAAIYDFTVFGGSIGEVGEKKVARLRDIALKSRLPIVWLVDSGGARLGAVQRDEVVAAVGLAHRAAQVFKRLVGIFRRLKIRDEKRNCTAMQNMIGEVQRLDRVRAPAARLEIEFPAPPGERDGGLSSAEYIAQPDRCRESGRPCRCCGWRKGQTLAISAASSRLLCEPSRNFPTRSRPPGAEW